MGDEWNKVTLEQIASTEKKAFAMGPFGSSIKKENYKPHGIPIIRGINLNADRFSSNDFVFLTSQKADELKASWAFPDDIIFVAQGSIGSIGIIPKSSKYTKYVLSQNLMKFSCDRKKADPLYLFYYFKSTLGQQEILSFANTTGVPCISQPLSSLKSFKTFLPPLPDQSVIAHILGKFDDKIELNQRMNETLEAMARLLFKSWFVDFEPVRAKAEGRETGLPEHIAGLFPDSFQDSELGSIPEGWKVQYLSEFVNIIGGGTPKTSNPEYWDGNVPWYSVVDSPNDSDVFVIDTEKHISIKGLNNSSTKILRIGTTIISARGTVGKCALVGHPMAMNQSCYGIQGIENMSDYFVYFTVRHQVNQLQKSGHGSVFNTITRDTFKYIPVVIPSIELVKAFDNIVNIYLNRILSNLKENKHLISLRDTLLPKLISGEIRVAEAEKLLKEESL